MTEAGTKPRDRWAEWLLRGRQQGMSEAAQLRMLRELERLRDRVLRGVRLRQGERVLDLGAGTGLLALAARRRVGSSGLVFALDISADGLQETRRLAAEEPDAAPLSAVLGDAIALPVADDIFDVVLTRSVLIYVDDKPAAIRELYRVLRLGGRVSIFEPINSASEQYDFGKRDFGALQAEHDRVIAYQRGHWDHREAMLGFDERDLVRWFVEAGFTLTMRYEFSVTRGRIPSRRRLPTARQQIRAGLGRRYNPSMLTYEEAARAVLAGAADEHLDRLVETMLAQPGSGASAAVYLTARKPPVRR